MWGMGGYPGRLLTVTAYPADDERLVSHEGRAGGRGAHDSPVPCQQGGAPVCLVQEARAVALGRSSLPPPLQVPHQQLAQGGRTRCGSVGRGGQALQGVYGTGWRYVEGVLGQGGGTCRVCVRQGGGTCSEAMG